MDPTLLSDHGPTEATITSTPLVPEPKQKVRIIAPGIDVSMDLDKATIEGLVAFALKIAAGR